MLSSPPDPSNHVLLSVSLNWPARGTACQRDHTVCVLLCLVYFTQQHVLKLSPQCSLCQNFLFKKKRLHSVPLCG